MFGHNVASEILLSYARTHPFWCSNNNSNALHYAYVEQHVATLCACFAAVLLLFVSLTRWGVLSHWTLELPGERVVVVSIPECLSLTVPKTINELTSTRFSKQCFAIFKYSLSKTSSSFSNFLTIDCVKRIKNKNACFKFIYTFYSTK